MIITRFGEMNAVQLVDLPELTVVKDLILETYGPDDPLLKTSDEKYPPTIMNLIMGSFDKIVAQKGEPAKGVFMPEVEKVYFLNEDADRIKHLLEVAAMTEVTIDEKVVRPVHNAAATMMLHGAMELDTPALPDYHPATVTA